MKALIIGLLLLLGVALIALTPVANVHVSSIGFKKHESIWATSKENTMATTQFAWLIQATGGVLILSGLVIGLRRRENAR